MNDTKPMTDVALMGNGDEKQNRDEDDDTKMQKLRRCIQPGGCLRENTLTVLTLLAVVVGIGFGFGLRESRTWTKREVKYVAFPGELFLRMLHCLILPLIVSSLISALGGLDTKLSGKIGIRAIAYYFATTLFAIVLGIVLVLAIRPGAGEASYDPTSKSKEEKPRPVMTADTLMDLVRNMFPKNIIEACTAQYGTILVEPENYTEVKNVTADYSTWEMTDSMGGGTNILGLVMFSVVMGVTLGKMQERGKPLFDIFVALSEAMMLITRIVIWFSPVGVLFLIAGKIIEIENLGVVAGQVGLYTATVLTGLFVHGFITLPLIYFILLRRLPFKFMLNMTQAVATAFGTASSSATLPVTIQCLEEKNGIDSRVSRFCLPIGATINMDGTALYEAVAAIFISQVRKVSLSVGSVIGISITATAASIGAAGIPQAGLVTMVMVLNVIGLPAEDAALVFVVDWFLDRFRTAINVLGDAFGAGIVAHLSVKDLEKISLEENRSDPENNEMTML